MGKLTVYKTDKGYYSVRPIDWECEIDKYGRIVQNGWNHTAIFLTKEDAEFFAKTKNAEEQGKLLILPCKPGDTVYVISKKQLIKCEVYGINMDYKSTWCTLLHEGDIFKSKNIYFLEDIGKTVFLTEQEAKEALKGMKK